MQLVRNRQRARIQILSPSGNPRDAVRVTQLGGVCRGCTGRLFPLLCPVRCFTGLFTCQAYYLRLLQSFTFIEEVGPALLPLKAMIGEEREPAGRDDRGGD